MDNSMQVCANCGTPTRQRCSRCKSLYVCKRECMAALWPTHKADCKRIVQGRKILGDSAAINPEDARAAAIEMMTAMAGDRNASFASDTPIFHTGMNTERGVEEGMAAIGGEQILELDKRQNDVYERYGISTPPTRDSAMPSKQKIAFFLDMLRVHDTSEEHSRTLPMSARMFLNRRYNNAYQEACKVLTPSENAKFHKLMQHERIGSHFKAAAY